MHASEVATDDMEIARERLQRVFGHAAFRAPQGEIVAHVAAGGDALVLMPTGGGKSLCYQLPALLRAGTAIVVSPLIALMQDQVEALRQLGVRAEYLNSSLDAGESARVERALAAGELDLLYVAPERLLTPRFLELLGRAHAGAGLALFAIDEAHCVSQWGHDFRPEYRQLTVLHERFPRVPRIALTATADTPTRNEIVERLALEDARRFVGSFDRPNIRYVVVPKSGGPKQLMAFLEPRRGQSGIVYCLSRRKVDETARALRAAGFDALPYHAGLDPAVRAANQRRFVLGEGTASQGIVVVATIAFGMGIDKPDVRFVAHLDLPKSMEAYYQETGRAGRDGDPSEAWLCYGLGDATLLQRMIAGSDAPDARQQVERRKLDALLGYCETTGCRRQALLAYFGEVHPGDCGNCDNCLEPPQAWDGTEAARKALSCVYRTGQRFGAAHVVDVLRGQASDKVRQFGHDALSTFGIGQELDARQWRSVFRQLLAGGLLEADVEGFGALRLTPASGEVLRGQRSLSLRRDAPATRPRRARGDTPSRAPSIELPDDALARFEALRRWRAETARVQGVPAYVVFHDSTLRAIALRAPETVDALADVDGIGGVKRERYGAALLEALERARG